MNKLGYGIMEYENGDVYEGCFIKGLKSGFGTYINKSG